MSRSFGSVRRLPSGRFQARYLIPGSLDDRRTAPMTFPTKRAAQDWLATERAEMLRATHAGEVADRRRETVTLTAYAETYLATRVDLSPRTHELYRYQLARWVNTPVTAPGVGTVHLGATELRRLDLPTMRRWHAAVVTAAATSAGTRGRTTRVHPARVWARSVGHEVADAGRLSPAILDAWRGAGSPTPARRRTGDTGGTQAAQAYRVVRAICTAATDDGLMTRNPCRLPRAGTTRAAERIPATPAQVTAIAAAMPAHLRAAVHLAAWTGLRAGELFALDRRRVDLTAGTVRVDRALVVVRSAVVGYGPPKTDSSRRTVHVPPHVLAILTEHMGTHTPPGDDALIFARLDTAGPITPTQRIRAFADARRAAGRDDLRWHDLRHTGATLAAQTGASVRELQHRLGHSTVSAAMIYQHHAADRDRALAARLSELAAQ